MSVIHPQSGRRVKAEHILYISLKNIFDLRNSTVRNLWARCYLPYAGFHFLLLPLAFLPFGSSLALTVLINKILAEILTNLHSFLVIGPNHTADDLHRFEFHYEGKKEFYVTQVLSSANYHCGNDRVDFLSIWLNYQIEHHLFPDLPMRKYQEVQPKVKALCEKHGIPYIQESVFKRFSKMAQVCVGQADMPRMTRIGTIGG
jgi:fatty acid desaturase